MSKKPQGDPLTEEEVMSALPTNGDVGPNFSAKRVTELINLERQARGRDPVKQGHVQIALQAMASAVPPRVGLLEVKPHLYFLLPTATSTAPPVAQPVSIPVAKPASEVSAPNPVAVQSNVKLATDVHLAENYLLPDERMPWEALVKKSDQELQARLEAARKRKAEIQVLVDPVHQELATKKTELALSEAELALSEERAESLQQELSEALDLVVQLRAECEGFAAKSTELETQLAIDPNDVFIGKEGRPLHGTVRARLHYVGRDKPLPLEDPEPTKPEEKPELFNWAIMAVVIIVCAIVAWKVFSV